MEFSSPRTGSNVHKLFLNQYLSRSKQRKLSAVPLIKNSRKIHHKRFRLRQQGNIAPKNKRYNLPSWAQAAQYTVHFQLISYPFVINIQITCLTKIWCACYHLKTESVPRLVGHFFPRVLPCLSLAASASPGTQSAPLWISKAMQSKKGCKPFPENNHSLPPENCFCCRPWIRIFCISESNIAFV